MPDQPIAAPDELSLAPDVVRTALRYLRLECDLADIGAAAIRLHRLADTEDYDPAHRNRLECAAELLGQLAEGTL